MLFTLEEWVSFGTCWSSVLVTSDFNTLFQMWFQLGLANSRCLVLFFFYSEMALILQTFQNVCCYRGVIFDYFFNELVTPQMHPVIAILDTLTLCFLYYLTCHVPHCPWGQQGLNCSSFFLASLLIFHVYYISIISLTVPSGMFFFFSCWLALSPRLWRPVTICLFNWLLYCFFHSF